MKAVQRVPKRGSASRGDERQCSLKCRSSRVFVFKNLSNYPEAILHLRKHLGHGAAMGTLRRLLTCIYGGRWGGKTEGRRRLTSQTRACCFPSHWLAYCICWSKVLSATWMHPWWSDAVWRWWNAILCNIKEDLLSRSGIRLHMTFQRASSKW